MQPGFLRREAQQRLHVVAVRMDAAVRNEPEQVHALPTVERRPQDRILEERTVLDRRVHAHQVLVEATPRTDCQVADLAIAHLARRQAGGRA